jgi:hypothetical protein
MFDTSKTAQVTAEMRAHRLDMLGVSECRWTGFGSLRTRDGETILYSGRDDNIHRAGVALVLRRGVEKTMVEWKPLNERLMRARFKGQHGKLTVLQCYAPTNDAEEEEKEQFYSMLQKEAECTPKHDVLIIMGDLNAKVGSSNDGYQQTMGNQGCGSMNDNGQRLANFCSENSLVIGGTLFPHKEIHKLTWESPNRRDKNQIDHLMINRMWRGSLQDVRVKRGADVGSDHHLVTAKIKIKLRRNGPTKNTTKRFNVKMLREPKVREVFNLTLRNRFQALSIDDDDDDDNIEERWTLLTKAYSESAQEVIGHRKKSDKEWMSEDTWQAIANRKNEKAKILQCKSERLKELQQQKYTRANSKVKRSARRDKRRYLDGLAKEAEEAARRNEQSKVYQIIRTLSGRKATTSVPIKDKSGKLLTTETEQEKRWQEHFEEVLNRPAPSIPADIPEAENDLPVNTEPPTITEIEKAIRSLKNGKAPGTDNLNAELFKTDPKQAANALHPLFQAIWKEENIPEQWRKGTIVKVPKKGNLADCNNWRGITLLSSPSKVLCKVITQRLGPALDKILRKEQSGFRPGRGCIEHISALRNIIEQCSEWQRELYIAFVDYEKAFDSLHRDSLWRILRAYGVPTKIVSIIKQFYHQFSCSAGSSDLSFEVKSGVRQGCVMSGLLFIVAVDWITTKATEDTRRGIRWTPFTQLEDMAYADDIALLSHAARQLQQKTNRLASYGEQIGLKVNGKKTKVMTVNVQRPVNITVGEEPIELVKAFTYLGSVVTEEGGAEEDIKSRLGKARRTFAQLNSVWRSRQFRVVSKLKIYQSCVVSVLLYGSECWRMTQQDSAALSSCHTSCLRKICRIFWPETISNRDLLKKTKQEDITTTIRRRRWLWVGHTLRREKDNIARTALTWTPEGRRRRGRPKITWRRTIEEEARKINRSWRDLETLAQDRHKWGNLVGALCASSRRKEPE